MSRRRQQPRKSRLLQKLQYPLSMEKLLKTAFMYIVRGMKWIQKK